MSRLDSMAKCGGTMWKVGPSKRQWVFGSSGYRWDYIFQDGWSIALISVYCLWADMVLACCVNGSGGAHSIKWCVILRLLEQLEKIWKASRDGRDHAPQIGLWSVVRQIWPCFQHWFVWNYIPNHPECWAQAIGDNSWTSGGWGEKTRVYRRILEDLSSICACDRWPLMFHAWMMVFFCLMEYCWNLILSWSQFSMYCLSTASAILTNKNGSYKWEKDEAVKQLGKKQAK